MNKRFRSTRSFIADSFVHSENLANHRRDPFSSRSSIFNPAIRSADAANLIPTSCPKCHPSYFVCFWANPFPRHGQFLYANLLITQRKHIGRVRCSLCRVYSRISLAVLLSSTPPVLLFALRRFEMLAPLRRWKSQKIPRPRQNYDRVCIEKETVRCWTPTVHIFT